MESYGHLQQLQIVKLGYTTLTVIIVSCLHYTLTVNINFWFLWLFFSWILAKWVVLVCSSALGHQVERES